MAIATYVNDQTNGWDEKLRQTRTGFIGHRHYIVDSRVVSEGIVAGGLPRIGDPWDAALADLKADDIELVEQGGVVSQTERGYSVWKVSYLTPELQVLDPTGSPWTELDLGTVQVTVYQGVTAAGLPSGESIVGGAPKEVGRVAAIVHDFVPKISGVPLAASLPFQGFTNSQQLTLPRVQRTPVGATFSEDEVLYLGIEDVIEVGAKLEVLHRVHLAPDFLHRESRVNDAGIVVGDREIRIYGQRDLRQVLP